MGDKLRDFVLQIALAVVGAVFGVLWFFQRNEIDEMKKGIGEANEAGERTRAALEAHKLFAAETYVRKPELERALAQLEEHLTENALARHAAQLSLLEDIRDRLPSRH